MRPIQINRRSSLGARRPDDCVAQTGTNKPAIADIDMFTNNPVPAATLGSSYARWPARTHGPCARRAHTACAARAGREIPPQQLTAPRPSHRPTKTSTIAGEPLLAVSPAPRRQSCAGRCTRRLHGHTGTVHSIPDTAGGREPRGAGAFPPGNA
ncbi:hypothetical protein WOLCODRAFT_147274 [Wolfiporia cocos MD-104 SS10]|uniref:Uncharacterized protein n=1 Tax=Wolfiporia cocos (strain MD-104) TaxID=742152 RepID=A0A2H3IUR3_WOLCO|nr:hypothetical protein WOLCODRAFT_147274 [Wolfiporia cocos MD-104 SS10]